MASRAETLGFLSNRQIDEIVDPQLRAQRAVAERRLEGENL